MFPMIVRSTGNLIHTVNAGLLFHIRSMAPSMTPSSGPWPWQFSMALEFLYRWRKLDFSTAWQPPNVCCLQPVFCKNDCAYMVLVLLISTNSRLRDETEIVFCWNVEWAEQGKPVGERATSSKSWLWVKWYGLFDKTTASRLQRPNWPHPNPRKIPSIVPFTAMAGRNNRVTIHHQSSSLKCLV